MLNRYILLLVLGAFGWEASAAVLPAEKLLPKDTALLVTAPDSPAAWRLLTNSPYGRLWEDPAVKGFKDKFMDKFGSDFLAPLQRTLGVQFSAYAGLAQGQATFALLPMAPGEMPGGSFARIFLLDTKDHAAGLRTNLADIRQKWAAAGKPMKTVKIRDIDFTTFVLAPGDLSWSKLLGTQKAGAMDDDTLNGSSNRVEMTFGQVDSLLLVSDSTQAIEKVISREQGGLMPALEEQPAFASDYAARLRGAPFYAWVNVKDSVDLLTKAAAMSEDRDSSSPFQPNSLLSAAGVTGVTSATFTYRSGPEGLAAQLFVGVPEDKRRGIFKAFVHETEDANPPSFVPEDVTKFWRWRINIPHTWTQVETMLNEFNPQYGSVINFVLQTAGKDKDEHYDLKSELLGSLGDDVIHYEKAPAGNSVADLNAAPSIYLIGSPNPDRLAAALKTGLSFMGAATERDFLGRKICTLTTQSQNGAPGRSFSFVGSGSYVALSSDSEMIEEFLRSDENKARTLGEVPGLSDAAQRVGGMGTGLFGYQNESASMRAVVGLLRERFGTLEDILGQPHALPGGGDTADQMAKVRDWADFSLLPPYDEISKYFYFSVSAGKFSPDGFTMNFFSPTPPKLR
jgi:hypothetical protein